MKAFFTMMLFISFNHVSGQDQRLVLIRDLSSTDKKCAAIQMENELDSFEPVSLANAYRAMAQMIRAKTTAEPFARLSYFHRGRKLLEASIREDASSIELRYLRFCVQTNVPFFLNYSSNIEEDKSFIIAHWHELNDPDLKHRIKMYMMRSGYCDDIEIKTLNNG